MEEPFYLNLKQIGTHWELDQEAIIFAITEKALNAGIDYPKIVSATMHSKTGPAVVTATRGTIEAVYATGEFIVNAMGHTEDGEAREVDLQMEMGAIADESRARRITSTNVKEEVRKMERDANCHRRDARRAVVEVADRARRSNADRRLPELARVALAVFCSSPRCAYSCSAGLLSTWRSLWGHTPRYEGPLMCWDGTPTKGAPSSKVL